MTRKKGFPGGGRARTSPGALRYRGRGTGEEGLSLIELMIAMALLAFVAIGILPMMVRSLTDNHRAWDATTVSNFAQSTLEPALAIDFDGVPLTLGAATTELLSSQVWTEGDAYQIGDLKEGWTTDPTGRGLVTWTQNTFVRQYDVEDLNAPLPGDTDPRAVNLKEIQVQVLSQSVVDQQSGGLLGAGQELWIRVFKAF